MPFPLHSHTVPGIVGTLSVLMAACVLSCRPSEPTGAPSREAPGPATEPGWFEDVTAAWGLDFVHDAGPTGTYFMPQSMGSGAAVFDFDGDGLLDIYLLQFGGPGSTSVNRLFRQTVPGTFRDVTEGSGLGIPGYNHGVAIGDVNNDGKPDVVVTQYGGLKLFLNLGGGRFADVTAASGLASSAWGASAAFVDYDRDGWLDLVVVSYVDHDPKAVCRSAAGDPDFCSPKAFLGGRSKLFRNRGRQPDGGALARVAFEDVSAASGIGRVAGPGLGVTVADFTGDGWPDIFVSNDGEPNRLWVRQPNGAFADEAVSRGVASTAMGKAFAGMGIAVGDVNNDGLIDLFVTHLGDETHTLWKQTRRGLFADASAATGVTGTVWRGTGFGTLLSDFDNDGALDLAIVNGRVTRGGRAAGTGLGFWETYAERNQLLANDGTGRFRDVSLANDAFCAPWNVARGLVAADFDADGGIDLLVTTVGARARLYRNVAANRGRWLGVRATDPARDRDAYGAEVRVRAGGKEYVRLINPAESYLCSGPPLAHFGLGAADTVEWIQVTWPNADGPLKEVFPGGAVNRLVALKRGEGRVP